MQHLINLSLYEMRRDEYQQEMAKINVDGWKSAQRRPYREGLAKALVALAARLAPTVAMPSTPTQALAE